MPPLTVGVVRGTKLHPTSRRRWPIRLNSNSGSLSTDPFSGHPCHVSDDPLISGLAGRQSATRPAPEARVTDQSRRRGSGRSANFPLAAMVRQGLETRKGFGAGGFGLT